MIRETFDNGNFRLGVAIVIGIPGTVLFFIALIYGIVFVIAAFEDFTLVTAAFALSALLGSFGILGAWLRLAKRSDKFTPGQRTFIKTSLACGITASLILFAIAVWLESYLVFGMPLLALAIGGVVFYVGT